MAFAPKSILAAVDGSERAAGVLATARDLAVRYGTGLSVLRVVAGTHEFPPAAAFVYADDLDARLRQAAFDELSELLAEVPDACATAIVRVGDPWRTILAVADELAVELIVIGSHGYGGWDRLLGTTADKVVNLAHRDVLVVHGPRGPG